MGTFSVGSSRLRDGDTLRDAAVTALSALAASLELLTSTADLTLNSLAYTCTIAGQSVKIKAGTLQIQKAIGKRSTCSFTVYDVTASLHFYHGNVIKIYDAYSNLAYAGFVDTSQERMSGYGTGTLVLESQITAMDNCYLADKRVCVGSYQNVTAGVVVNILLANYLAAEGVTAGLACSPTLLCSPSLLCESSSIATGTICSPSLLCGPTILCGGSPVIPEIDLNYIPVSQALDDLAKRANYFWNITDSKALIFGPYTQNLAPWAFDGTQVQDGSVSVTRNGAKYRNQQYILNITDVTSLQTERRVVDGTTQSFTMSFPLAQVPTSIMLNGTTQTMGQKGIDTGKQWYWGLNDPVIAQDSNSVKLTSADTLIVAYFGRYPTVAQTKDAAAITRQIAAEGGTTTGLVETAESDPTLTSSASAQAYAAQLLARYASWGTQLQFKTKRSGLAEGQLLTANYSYHALNNAQMLIESLKISDDGMALWYEPTAIIGAYDTTWVDFWNEILAVEGTPNVSNSASSGAVTINATFVFSATPTFTFTANVFTAVFCSPSLLCSPTQLCC